MAGRSDMDLLEGLLAIEERLISAYEAALRRRNPRASVPQFELTAALRSRGSFARFALDLEARALTSYADAAASMRNPRLRQPLGSIMACEAAHEVALRNSLGDRPLVD